jgi:hypothetical protein
MFIPSPVVRLQELITTESLRIDAILIHLETENAKIFNTSKTLAFKKVNLITEYSGGFEI